MPASTDVTPYATAISGNAIIVPPLARLQTYAALINERMKQLVDARPLQANEPAQTALSGLYPSAARIKQLNDVRPKHFNLRSYAAAAVCIIVVVCVR